MAARLLCQWLPGHQVRAISQRVGFGLLAWGTLLSCSAHAWALSTHCSHGRQRLHVVDIPDVTQCRLVSLHQREPTSDVEPPAALAERRRLFTVSPPAQACLCEGTSQQGSSDTAGLAHFLCGPDPAAMELRGSHTVVRNALCLLFQLRAGRPMVGRLHTDIAGPALGSQLPTGTCAQPPGGPQGDLAVQRRFWNWSKHRGDRE